MQARPADNTESDDELVERLAAEFLERSAREKLDAETYIAQLTSPEQRVAFEEILRFGLAPESLMPSSIELGAQLGPYRILEQLGAGGMGVVYRAFDTRLERKVALKVLSPEAAGDAQAEQRLVTESKLLARLQHVGIVAVHEARVHGRTRFVVMDLIEGVSLDVLLQRLRRQETRPRRGADLLRVLDLGPVAGELPLIEPKSSYARAVALLFREVARAIDAAHAQGVLHRDIKPGNVIVRSGGRPVVLDFGLGGLAQTHWSPELEPVLGTPPYMAPEQLQRPRRASDQRGDIYQLGVLLYELLTLRAAFPQKSFETLRAHIRSGKLALPRETDPSIPRDLEAICLKAMHVDPAKRYASVEALVEDLGRFLAGRPLAIHPPSLSRSMAYFVRRHRAILALLLLTLLIGGGVNWALWPGDSAVEIKGWIGRDERLERLGRLSDKDVFALTVECASTTELAAFWVCGPGRDGDDIAYIAPVKLISAHPISNVIALTPGTHTVLTDGDFDLANARRLAKDSPTWFEGLWVMYDSKIPAWAHEWIQGLQETPTDEAHGDMLQRVQAFDLLHGLLQSSRGLGELTEEERAALERLAQNGTVSKQKPWPMPTPRFFDLWAEVKFDD
ncbi:MAG: serine/threonine protein kinase [Planctomycetes bacterium]|nr:serine/threonine protein kinase [Planctomycetota bacterium]